MVEPELTITSHIIASIPQLQLITSFIGTTYLELAAFTIGLFIYAVFVWKFYTGLSKRDLFTIDLGKYKFTESKWEPVQKAADVLIYIFKYLIIFPLYLSFWLGLLSLFLFLLAKEVAVNQIMIISVAVISTTRLTSYYREQLAIDLAKLLPFAMLAILLTDPLFFSLDTFYARVLELPTIVPFIIDFFIFTIALEWTMRLLYTLKVWIFKKAGWDGVNGVVDIVE